MAECGFDPEGGPVAGCMSLAEAMGGRDVEAAMQVNFSEMASEAVGVAVARPDVSANDLDAARSDLMGAHTGTVGDEKMQVISSVERPGAPARTDGSEQADKGEALEERVRSLYFELTNYQVAWKIAQRMQQDTSQLLRGQ